MSASKSSPGEPFVRLRAAVMPTLLVALLLSLAACETPPQPSTYDPDARLDILLTLYRQNLDAGSSCQEAWNAGHKTVDCERVLRAVERLAVEFPEHARIGLSAALMSYQAGRADKAQYHLDVLLTRQPVYPEAVVLRSRIALEQGNATLARRLVEQQLRLSPGNAQLYESLAAVEYFAGNFDEAAAALLHADRRGAPKWRLAFHRGLLAEADRHWAQARLHYRRCLMLNPAFDRARAQLDFIQYK